VGDDDRVPLTAQDNFFILEDMTVKISDFASKLLVGDLDERLLEVSCSEFFLAPEARRTSYTASVDIWSFGVLCARVLRLIYNSENPDLYMPVEEGLEYVFYFLV
jgi:serine/threonine protein kinase